MKDIKYTQEEMKEVFLPILNENGLVYKKAKRILARPAKDSENIATITADGLETYNSGKEGDYIIRNLTEAGEEYIIDGEKFRDRYEFLEETLSEYALYKPKGRVIALELTPDLLMQLELTAPFYFVPTWGGEMIIKTNDYLVCPLELSEVYRIARKEFFETYVKE